MKYTLTVTKDQARAISRACGLLARMGLGQVHYLSLLPGWYNNKTEELREKLWEWELKLMAGGMNLRNEFDIYNAAWDTYQVVRHRLAWDEMPEGGDDVMFHDPLKTAADPLPTIQRTKRTRAELKRLAARIRKA